MSAEHDLVDCPYCVRGQVANPEVYPHDAFALSTRDLTRRVIEVFNDADRGHKGRHAPMFVRCSKCIGTGRLSKGKAAQALLVDPHA